MPMRVSMLGSGADFMVLSFSANTFSLVNADALFFFVFAKSVSVASLDIFSVVAVVLFALIQA